MKEVCFKNIIIADTLKHTARYQEFQKGLNVITSADNHVGKSSLIKSLYYTLGAEVKFDEVWDKNTKLYIVSIAVGDQEYRIARFQKNFAIFKGDELILLTNSVSHELAKKMEEIYSFAIYLADKNEKKVKLAPPALTYMPYYIDQDKGWSDLYGSFESLDQFTKAERKKSLYYHLQIYTRQTIELMANRDELKEQLEELKKKESDLRITLAALSNEMNNVVPAENVEELDRNIALPKEKIAELVGKIGTLRNEIQEIESSLAQSEHQLSIIEEYKKIKNDTVPTAQVAHVCPRCGYSFDEELYEAVRSNYNINNEEYLAQQVQYIISTLKDRLSKREEQYVALCAELQELEKSYDESEDAYSVYLRHRGLQESLNRFSSELKDNVFNQHEIVDEIKGIDKELRKLPNKKAIEQKYINYVRLNIMGLGAWNSSYDGKIKLLQPIKAQGSLVSKIILAQCIGLFQTMAAQGSDVTKFPLIIDSPRGNEASVASSRDILDIIGHVDSLPQVILATVDYDKYITEEITGAKVTRLSERNKLLLEDDYQTYQSDIEDVFELLKSFATSSK